MTLEAAFEIRYYQAWYVTQRQQEKKSRQHLKFFNQLDTFVFNPLKKLLRK